MVFKNPTDAATGSTSNYQEFNFDNLEIFIGNTNPSPATTGLVDKSTNSVPVSAATITPTLTVGETISSSTPSFNYHRLLHYLLYL